MRGRLLSIILIIALVFRLVLSPIENIASEIQNDLRIAMADASVEATQFVESRLNDIIEVSRDYANDLGVRKTDFDNATLGKPFIIYDLDSDTQNEVFYYPLINEETGNTFLVIIVLGTTGGWQYNINTNLVNELNQLNLPKDEEDYIFYHSESGLVVQTEDKEIYFPNKNQTKSKRHFSNKSARDFDNKAFKMKKKVIINDLIKLKKIKSSNNFSGEKIDDSTFGAYNATVTDEEKLTGYYYNNLYNARGQGNYNLCWAACVATVVNYIKGRSITAKNVADAIGRGYNDGGSAEHTKQALKHYGTDYGLIYWQYTYENIQYHIKKKKPLIAFGMANPTGEHMVTIYGYRNLSSGNLIMFWDSSINSNNGGMSIATYKSDGTVFVGGTNKAYSWAATMRSK